MIAIPGDGRPAGPGVLDGRGRRGQGPGGDARRLLADGEPGGGHPGADRRDGVRRAPRRPRRRSPLVNQHGLQFEPRVQVVRVGQTLRFTNQDAETHNVHILTPGFPFNRSMAPNVPADFVPDKPGADPAGLRHPQPHEGLRRRDRLPLGQGLQGGRVVPVRRRPRRPLRPERLARDGRAAPPRGRGQGRARPLDLGTIVLKGFPVVAPRPRPRPRSGPGPR